MPLTLANGEVIYNVTPHELDVWDEEEKKMYTVLTDDVINARAESELLEKRENYVIVHMNYHPTEYGVEVIQRIRRECPRAIIIGSVIAAQAYPGEVFAPSPVKYSRDRKYKKFGAIHSNRFTSF